MDNSYPKVIFHQTNGLAQLSIKSQNSIEVSNSIDQNWINKLSWKLNPDSLKELSLILKNALQQIKNRNTEIKISKIMKLEPIAFLVTS